VSLLVSLRDSERRSDPAKVRFVLKYKHAEGSLTLRATNDELVRLAVVLVSWFAVAHLQDGPGERHAAPGGRASLAAGGHVRRDSGDARRRRRQCTGRYVPLLSSVEPLLQTSPWAPNTPGDEARNREGNRQQQGLVPRKL